MPDQSEYEARIRTLEQAINLLGYQVAKLSDQVGELAQNAAMAKMTPGMARSSGNARIAKTDGSGIPAMSGTTLGFGTVTLYDADEDGLLVAGDDTVAHNLATGADGDVAPNTFIQLKRVDDRWLVDWEQCA